MAKPSYFRRRKLISRKNTEKLWDFVNEQEKEAQPPLKPFHVRERIPAHNDISFSILILLGRGLDKDEDC